jgi:hypothetical protein
MEAVAHTTLAPPPASWPVNRSQSFSSTARRSGGCHRTRTQSLIEQVPPASQQRRPVVMRAWMPALRRGVPCRRRRSRRGRAPRSLQPPPTPEPDEARDRALGRAAGASSHRRPPSAARRSGSHHLPFLTTPPRAPVTTEEMPIAPMPAAYSPASSAVCSTSPASVGVGAVHHVAELTDVHGRAITRRGCGCRVGRRRSARPPAAMVDRRALRVQSFAGRTVHSQKSGRTLHVFRGLT